MSLAEVRMTVVLAMRCVDGPDARPAEQRRGGATRGAGRQRGARGPGRAGGATSRSSSTSTPTRCSGATRSTACTPWAAAGDGPEVERVRRWVEQRALDELFD